MNEYIKKIDGASESFIDMTNKLSIFDDILIKLVNDSDKVSTYMLLKKYITAHHPFIFNEDFEKTFLHGAYKENYVNYCEKYKVEINIIIEFINIHNAFSVVLTQILIPVIKSLSNTEIKIPHYITQDTKEKLLKLGFIKSQI